MKKTFVAFGLLAALFITVSPLFAKNMWLKSENASMAIVDLTQVLPPPPAEGSQEYLAELKELESYQNGRSKEQEAYVGADEQKSVFRFANVLGDKFTAENLPLTAALFDKALKISKATVTPAKNYFDRTRPFLKDKNLTPSLGRDTDPCYPSGHSTAGMMMAVLLAQMVPEKKGEILKRGWEYARNREVGGVHYRSDIEAGRTSGILIGNALLKDKDFARDFDAAKTELRKVLSY